MDFRIGNTLPNAISELKAGLSGRGLGVAAARVPGRAKGVREARAGRCGGGGLGTVGMVAAGALVALRPVAWGTLRGTA